MRSGSPYINFSSFYTLIANDFLLRRIVLGQMMIQDFPRFTRNLEDIYNRVHQDTSGEVASYIPQLANVNPEQFGLAVCTVDGQRFHIGDYDKYFCVQSCSKPITYCCILSELGEEKVHQHIGHEPSGSGFNERILNYDGLPHNPMINSGAIMSIALFLHTISESERFDSLMNIWRRLTGDKRITFDNSTYLSERSSADRNYSLAYMMREEGKFPPNTDINVILELYFMACSIEQTCDMMSIVAATLAFGGINPLTNERIFSSVVVRRCLSLMASCGMYDASGEFAFTVGFPCKSGVSGVLMMVIPGRCGICTWSPRIDRLGNSIRGLLFCREMIKVFHFHIFSNQIYKVVDSLDSYDLQIHRHKNRRTIIHGNDDLIHEDRQLLMVACANGWISLLQICVARGVDINTVGLDGATGLHLATIHNHIDIVRYLQRLHARTDIRDEYNRTPIDIAELLQHTTIIHLQTSKKLHIPLHDTVIPTTELCLQNLVLSLDIEGNGNISSLQLKKRLQEAGYYHITQTNISNIFTFIDTISWIDSSKVVSTAFSKGMGSCGNNDRIESLKQEKEEEEKVEEKTEYDIKDENIQSLVDACLYRTYDLVNNITKLSDTSIYAKDEELLMTCIISRVYNNIDKKTLLASSYIINEEINKNIKALQIYDTKVKKINSQIPIDMLISSSITDRRYWDIFLQSRINKDGLYLQLQKFPIILSIIQNITAIPNWKLFEETMTNVYNETLYTEISNEFSPNIEQLNDIIDSNLTKNLTSSSSTSSSSSVHIVVDDFLDDIQMIQERLEKIDISSSTLLNKFIEEKYHRTTKVATTTDHLTETIAESTIPKTHACAFKKLHDNNNTININTNIIINNNTTNEQQEDISLKDVKLTVSKSNLLSNNFDNPIHYLDTKYRTTTSRILLNCDDRSVTSNDTTIYDDQIIDNDATIWDGHSVLRCTPSDKDIVTIAAEAAAVADHILNDKPVAVSSQTPQYNAISRAISISGIDSNCQQCARETCPSQLPLLDDPDTYHHDKNIHTNEVYVSTPIDSISSGKNINTNSFNRKHTCRRPSALAVFDSKPKNQHDSTVDITTDLPSKDYNDKGHKDSFYVDNTNDIISIDKNKSSSFISKKNLDLHLLVLPSNDKNIVDSVNTSNIINTTNTKTNTTQLNNILAVAACSVSGQQMHIGPANEKFCAKSLSKIVSYCIAQEICGEEYVHTYIGKEPSGRDLTELCLDYNKRPHNPYINAGAIMCASLLLPDSNISTRFKYILMYWEELTCDSVSYDVPSYLLEKEHADRNYCLAYMMKDANCFPSYIRTHRDIEALLDFYFLCCSITISTVQASILAATLANGGKNPITQVQVLKSSNVRNALSIMATSGMYNYSGEFAFYFGLPAKSSSGGALLVCVPNTVGLCTYSPEIDKLGNSILGLRFVKKLSTIYSFHIYDVFDSHIYDARQGLGLKEARILEFLCAAKYGDYYTLQSFMATGMSTLVTNSEGRTAFHYAARNGHISSIFLLIWGTLLELQREQESNNNNNSNSNTNNSITTNKQTIKNIKVKHIPRSIEFDFNLIDNWNRTVIEDGEQCTNKVAGQLIKIAIQLASASQWDRLQQLQRSLHTRALSILYSMNHQEAIESV